MPDQHIFLGNYSPVESRRDEFEAWWPIHVREVVDNIEGFVAAQRYRLCEQQRPWSPPASWKCLMIYELEGDDVDAIHRDNTRVRESNIYTPFDGLVEPGSQGHVYTPVGVPYRRAGWEGRTQASHIVVVRSNPTDGNDEAYNEWYDNHLHEFVENIQGYAGAQRYRLNASQRPGMTSSKWQYVSIYELDDTDLPVIFRSNEEMKDAGVFTPWTGLLQEEHIGHVFTPVPPRVLQAGAREDSVVVEGV
jgi:hypothetical protein